MQQGCCKSIEGGINHSRLREGGSGRDNTIVGERALGGFIEETNTINQHKSKASDQNEAIGGERWKVWYRSTNVTQSKSVSSAR